MDYEKDRFALSDLQELAFLFVEKGQLDKLFKDLTDSDADLIVKYFIDHNASGTRILMDTEICGKNQPIHDPNKFMGFLPCGVMLGHHLIGTLFTFTREPDGKWEMNEKELNRLATYDSMTKYPQMIPILKHLTFM